MNSSSPNGATAELLSGRYRLGDVIGRGGMASVYSAKDLNLGRDVALKLFARGLQILTKSGVNTPRLNSLPLRTIRVWRPASTPVRTPAPPRNPGPS